MNSSQKWLVAIGSALTLGIAAVAAHAATDEHSGTDQHMNRGMMGGMHGGAQADQKRGGHGMSSMGQTGHQHGMGNAMSGEHREIADARRTERHGSGTENHQHEQGAGKDHGSGEHSH